MINQQDYVNEKLRQADAERMRVPLDLRVLQNERKPRPRAVVGPVVRFTGHRMRHIGEALESWAMRQPLRG